ncbi:MAG: MBL fold metallo-hydrolase [Solirubrobacteraceae bacterium]
MSPPERRPARATANEPEGAAAGTPEGAAAGTPEGTAAGADQQAGAHLAAAAAAGIHTIALPTPFRVGRVNVYLIDDEPLTLVDAGPSSRTTLQELEAGLARLGRSIEELQLIVITHQHLDHFGLAALLARRSGAEVAAIDALVPYLRDFEREAVREDEFAVAAMLRHGVPSDYARGLQSVSASYRSWGAPVEVGVPLRDGGELQLRDRRFTVLWRPGHSPSDTVFHDAERSMLIGGDHLLKKISSNATVTRPLPGQERELEAASHLDGRGAPLLAYAASMRATAAMDVELVLPGHGPLFGEPAALVAERCRLHDRRAEKIADVLASGPRTAHEIAQVLWGDVALTQAYLTLSEVLGHIDLLALGGRVEETLHDETIRFERC